MSLARNLSKLAQFLNGSGLLTSLGLAPDAVQVGMKNRIINGAMVIDQRNAGASVTPTSSAIGYPVDRFFVEVSQNSKLTTQQNAGSVTPPSGFTKYLGITSSSSYSVLTGDYFHTSERIEGFNVLDLGWGTASASPVTLSFWVRSSLTGTFGGSLTNSAFNRSYPFTYTISAANTWEQKSITIAGDTTGTWLTDNGTGIRLYLSVGAGASLSGTAGAWAGAGYTSATGATNLMATNGATFYITGVQLEKGSTATSFDYRPYGTELALCKRYYHRITNASTYVYLGNGRTVNATYGDVILYLPTTMRSQPTMSYSSIAHFQCAWSGTCNVLSLSSNQSSVTVDTVLLSVGPGTGNSTSVQMLQFNNASTSAFIDFSAEL